MLRRECYEVRGAVRYMVHVVGDERITNEEIAVHAFIRQANGPYAALEEVYALIRRWHGGPGGADRGASVYACDGLTVTNDCRTWQVKGWLQEV